MDDPVKRKGGSALLNSLSNRHCKETANMRQYLQIEFVLT